MARKTALLAFSVVLLVCLTLVTVVRSTHSQEAAGSVRGFPFLYVGQTYSTGPYEFQILQDFGNGWVAVPPGLTRCGRAPRGARPTAVSWPGRGARGHMAAPRPGDPPGPCHLARGASIS